jgi:fermentation-respiration switch protein FrsA (DUF1100 family)
MSLMRLLILACLGSLAACRDRTPPTPEPSACAGAKLRPSPDDLAARGPWSVGVRTVEVGSLRVEVWYPAPPGSEQGGAPVRYDPRDSMPASEAAKIPDAAAAWLACDCVRDLPVDTAHGPYPVILFLHGAASFRFQSAFLATHWASRGFVTIAPELPGVGLRAILGGEPTAFPLSVPSDLLAAIVQRPASSDPFAFVRPQLGPRLAVVGHSLGAMLASSLGDRPEIAVRIALAGTLDRSGTGSRLVITGETDGIAPPSRAPDRLAGLPSPARAAIVRGAGHLAFTDLCLLGADRGGSLAIARAHGVKIPDMIATLATDGCRPSDAPFATTAPTIRALTIGVLEETLRCDPAKAAAIHALGDRGDLELLEQLTPSAPR